MAYSGIQIFQLNSGSPAAATDVVPYTGQLSGTAQKTAISEVVRIGLVSGSITSGKIASGAVNNVNLASGIITNFKIGSGAVLSGNIASGQIGANHLASGVMFTLGSGAERLVRRLLLVETLHQVQ